MATPSTTKSQPMPSAGGCDASVVATAIAMPIMPKKLPWRDDAGLESPRSDRMNNTPATRYKTADRLAFIESPPLSSSPRGARHSLGFLLVHRQHALRDEEAAENVHRREDQRDEAKAARRPRSPRRLRSSPTSTAYAARALPTTPRNSRRTRRARKSTAGTRRDRRLGRDDPWRLSLSGFRLKVRMNDRAILGQGGGLDQFVVPLHRERLGRFVDQRFDEGKQVARIKARGRGRDAAGEIGDADDLHAVEVHGFAASSALDIAAALNREID